MKRTLILVGLLIILVGLLWPFLVRLGIGRLPGDIVIHRDNVTLYFPLTTMILVGIVASLVLWFLNR